MQRGAAGAAEPQRQRQPQQRAQQQGGGQDAPPCGERHVTPPAAPTPAPAAPATQSPILRAAAAGAGLCPHLALGQRGRCPGCPPHRGSCRSGGPSPAHSGSARGCCTPERVTLSLRACQIVTSSARSRAPHSPRARCTGSGTAGLPAPRRPGSGAGGRPAGEEASALGAPPAALPLPRPSPSRGRRRYRAAPWPHRSRPRPQAGGSLGRTLLTCPRGRCRAGTAASHSRRPCRGRGVRGGGGQWRGPRGRGGTHRWAQAT